MLALAGIPGMPAETGPAGPAGGVTASQPVDGGAARTAADVFDILVEAAVAAEFVEDPAPATVLVPSAESTGQPPAREAGGRSEWVAEPLVPFADAGEAIPGRPVARWTVRRVEDGAGMPGRDDEGAADPDPGIEPGAWVAWMPPAIPQADPVAAGRGPDDALEGAPDGPASGLDAWTPAPPPEMLLPAEAHSSSSIPSGAGVAPRESAPVPGQRVVAESGEAAPAPGEQAAALRPDRTVPSAGPSGPRESTGGRGGETPPAQEPATRAETTPESTPPALGPHLSHSTERTGSSGPRPAPAATDGAHAAPGVGRGSPVPHTNAGVPERVTTRVMQQGTALPPIETVAPPDRQREVPEGPLGPGADAPVDDGANLARQLPIEADPEGGSAPRQGGEQHTPAAGPASPAAMPAAASVAGLTLAAGSPTAPVQTPAPHLHAEAGEGVTHQIVQSLRTQVRGGVSQAIVRLTPEHLGEVTIAIRVERGVVDAAVTAAVPAVREWLESQESVVRQHLEEQGLSLARLRVDADGSRREGEQPGARDQAPPRRWRPAANPTARFDVVV